MKRSYLIQRLLKPHDNVMLSAFAFGGGLVNGGFSKEAMNILKSVFSFDYMGSAEFEWGAVPEFFVRLVENRKEYDFFETDVNNTTIYIMGKKALTDETIQRINELTNPLYTTKE